MRGKLLRYYQTLRHLKPQQLRANIAHKLGFKGKRISLAQQGLHPEGKPLELKNPMRAPEAYIGANHFSFINVPHRFASSIDWNFAAHGKLWIYNLNYFDFLQQEGLAPSAGRALMEDYILQHSALRDGLEPYPTSLRLINWIWFVARNKVHNQSIDATLWHDAERLLNNLEYRLLGNHLLENGFGLLFAGAYFRNAQLLEKASEVLLAELDEQILSDGAHFELAPMYHQIILGRVLQAIDLLTHNIIDGTEAVRAKLNEVAPAMLGWLKAMQFANGDVPRVNDSVEGIAPAPAQLFAFAQVLNLQPKVVELGASGYRKATFEQAELLMDVGNIGPDYIPGHAHSDSLSFVLHCHQRPVLVDTGISTYEKNAQRQAERGTTAHNTVMVKSTEQSDVWGGFRVGRRAQATIHQHTEHKLVASHNGYQHLGIEHTRTFEWQPHSLIITDALSAQAPAQAFFHFHPTVQINIAHDHISGIFGRLMFTGARQISTSEYQYANGFNNTAPAVVVIVDFDQQLTTAIQLA